MLWSNFAATKTTTILLQRVQQWFDSFRNNLSGFFLSHTLTLSRSQMLSHVALSLASSLSLSVKQFLSKIFLNFFSFSHSKCLCTDSNTLSHIPSSKKLSLEYFPYLILNTTLHYLLFLSLSIAQTNILTLDSTPNFKPLSLSLTHTHTPILTYTLSLFRTLLAVVAVNFGGLFTAVEWGILLRHTSTGIYFPLSLPRKTWNVTTLLLPSSVARSRKKAQKFAAQKQKQKAQ